MNLAVNNLLSRDEEDGEDQEEGESYVPGGKLSLISYFYHFYIRFIEVRTHYRI